MVLKYRTTMKTAMTRMMRASKVLLMLSLLAVIFLSACQREAPVTPSTSVDDHGSGGHGADDPPGDDNGGGN